MSQTMLITQIIILTTGAFCLYIAAQLGRRQPAESDDRLAWLAFRVWWLAIGLSTALGAVRTLMALFAVDSLAAYSILTLVLTLVLCAALWGLLYYLVYLYTGNRSWVWPLAGFYGLIFLGLISYLFLVLRPIGVSLDNGAASMQYANDAPDLYGLIVVLVILLPQLLAALAYLSLYFRLHERTQKYRILLVSLSILIWFASPLVGLGLGISNFPWWDLLSRIIGLAAVLLIYAAYYPPKFIQRRFGVAGI